MFEVCNLCWLLLVALPMFVFYGRLFQTALRVFVKKCIRSKVDLQKYSRDGNTWALVTGATDGIGKAFALGLAEKGFNIIIVGRSEFKLNKVKDEIKAASHMVVVKTIKVDFVLDEVSAYRNKIKDDIKGLKISVLVNNVGMMQSFTGRFHTISEDVEMSSIKCNILSFSTLNRLVIPQMVDRKFGVIINVSSLASKMDFPGVAIYSGTKAYMTKASNIMAEEYKEHGIFVQTVNPGFVKTKISAAYENMTPKFAQSTPETLASTCLDTLGQERELTGHWFHSIQEFLLEYTFFYPWGVKQTGLCLLKSNKKFS